MPKQTPTESVTAAARRPQLSVSVQPPNACHTLRGVWETTGPPRSQATVTGSPSVGKCTILWGGQGGPYAEIPTQHWLWQPLAPHVHQPPALPRQQLQWARRPHPVAPPPAPLARPHSQPLSPADLSLTSPSTQASEAALGGPPCPQTGWLCRLAPHPGLECRKPRSSWAGVPATG